MKTAEKVAWAVGGLGFVAAAIFGLEERQADGGGLIIAIACYACQLGDLKEAFGWLTKAIDLAGKEDIRQIALDDRDLEPLWLDISEI